jgi:DNA-binding GntR family transcriptional regulator
LAEKIGPSYQRVADDIRSKISSGELAVGDPIPSTVKLMEQYGVSSTVVRHAVAQLQAEGIAIGHSGKAVYVQARPADVASDRADVDQLRDALGTIEANLIDLYGKLGYDYPRGDAPARRAARTPAAKRERLA